MLHDDSGDRLPSSHQIPPQLPPEELVGTTKEATAIAAMDGDELCREIDRMLQGGASYPSLEFSKDPGLLCERPKKQNTLGIEEDENVEKTYAHVPDRSV